MSKRKEATELAIKLLSEFAGKTASVKQVESMLNNLTDKQFHAYMEALSSGDEILPYIIPNLTRERITVDKNIRIAKKLNHSFFERLWLTDPATGDVYLTPEEYLVIDLPVKRLQQHLHKKISIPTDNKRVDELTAQPTGDSKGSKISFPELQILYSHGLNDTIRELFKFRAGDEEAYRAMEREASATGEVRMDNIDDGTTRTKATITLETLLTSAHLSNNVAD